MPVLVLPDAPLTSEGDEDDCPTLLPVDASSREAILFSSMSVASVLSPEMDL